MVSEGYNGVANDPNFSDMSENDPSEDANPCRITPSPSSEPTAASGTSRSTGSNTTSAATSEVFRRYHALMAGPPLPEVDTELVVSVSVTVAGLMGHADAGMVQRVYSHMGKAQDFLAAQLKKAAT